MAEADLVTVAILGEVCAYHLHRVRAFFDGSRVAAVEDVLVGDVALVEKDVQLLGLGEHGELEGRVARVLVRVRVLVPYEGEVGVDNTTLRGMLKKSPGAQAETSPRTSQQKVRPRDSWSPHVLPPPK
jgi:hypothetical protein